MKLKKGISVCILTKNSEEQLITALESVRSFASEIIIVDGFSIDDTVKIAKNYKCKIFQKKFEGFAAERNFAISKSTFEWIFEIDSDEEVSQELKSVIIQSIESTKYSAFYIYRKDMFLKREFYDLKLIRLYKNGALHYVGTTHERVIFNNKVRIGFIKGALLHHAKDSETIFGEIKEWDVDTEKQIVNPLRFGKKRMGRIKLYYRMFIYPFIHLFGLLIYKRFLFKGMNAIIWAIMAAFYEFIIYAKYYEVYYLKVRPVNTSKMVYPNPQKKIR
jgi:glycosyltransferase involved in cell wall biosynthesis